MNRVLLTGLRITVTATLIVGSIYVQHVAREQQPQHRYAGLQLSDSVEDELATYVIESGRIFLALMR